MPSWHKRVVGLWHKVPPLCLNESKWSGQWFRISPGECPWTGMGCQVGRRLPYSALLPSLQHLAFGTLHKRHTHTCPFILSARPTDLCPLSMESPVWLTVLSGSLWSRCEPHVSTQEGFEGGISDRGWEGRMQRGHRRPNL